MSMMQVNLLYSLTIHSTLAMLNSLANGLFTTFLILIEMV